MRTLAASLFTLLLPTVASAQAMVEVPNAPPPPRPALERQSRAPSRFEVLVELAPGIDVPLSGGDYSANFGPSFTMDGRFGVLIWMHQRRYALVPELTIGGTPLSVGGTTAPTASTTFFGSGFSRVHGEAGLRLHLPLARIVTLYARAAVGVDYLQGEFVGCDGCPGENHTRLDAAATSFLIEAGVGVQIALGRHIGIGAYVGVPVAPSVRLDERSGITGSHLAYDRFAAVDFTASAVASLRL
jgi:hypothetical protein